MLQPIITGLPTSNHDHGVNGGVFTDAGELLICVGGMTNRGIKSKNLGGFPESYYAAAVLKANVSFVNDWWRLTVFGRLDGANLP